MKEQSEHVPVSERCQGAASLVHRCMVHRSEPLAVSRKPIAVSVETMMTANGLQLAVWMLASTRRK